MAFSGLVSNSGGSRGRRRFSGASSISEMNVVPLVDVVLVLLIIFMLTASAFEFGLEIQVPKISQTRTTVQEFPVVSVDRGSKIYLNERQVNINRLGEEIKSRFKGEKKVYLKADKEITVDTYLQVVDALGRANLDVLAVAQAGNIPEKR